MMSEPSGVRIVLTTESDVETAKLLARSLLEARIVACATLIPVHSLYHWNDGIDQADEVQILFKTTDENVAAAMSAISGDHSYDLPEILVLEASASAAYERWVGTETVGDTGLSR